MSISIYSPTLQMSTKGGGGLLAATETEDGAIQIFGAVQSFLARGALRPLRLNTSYRGRIVQHCTGHSRRRLNTSHAGDSSLVQSVGLH